MDPIAKAMYGNIFLKPSDPEQTVLWRYLGTDPDDAERGNVNKFASLIECRTLWLTRASDLKDTLEGLSTENSLLNEQRIWEHDGEYYDEQEELRIEEEMRDHVFVNCWHRNDAEAICMWAEYCGVKQGIVVRTTFAKLEAACNAMGEENIFGCGCIEYVDLSSYIIPPGDVFYPFMHKDMKLAIENEVRIAHLKVIHDNHIDMPVNLGELIDGIYVHPLATENYYYEVASMLQEYAPELLSRLHWSELKGNTSLRDFALLNKT
jgi:hypothetical protein